ncbi:MAG TPA: hypothetical protein VGM02_04325 [Acidobacteriaceae bacterium]|jgi:hypothetical protein
MTLLVFLGIVVSLLILRLVPGLLLRLVLAIPRHHLIAITRWVRDRRIGIVLPRKTASAFAGEAIAVAPRRSGSRLKLVLVSSSLLFLAILATTAFWSWHSTALMMLLR